MVREWSIWGPRIPLPNKGEAYVELSNEHSHLLTGSMWEMAESSTMKKATTILDSCTACSGFHNCICAAPSTGAENATPATARLPVGSATLFAQPHQECRTCHSCQVFFEGCRFSMGPETSSSQSLIWSRECHSCQVVQRLRGLAWAPQPCLRSP